VGFGLLLMSGVGIVVLQLGLFTVIMVGLES